MTSDAVTVLRDALALSESDRASIAAELLASLPEPESAVDIDSDEWVREIEDRARGVISGDTVLEDWDAVEPRILGTLSKG